MNLDKLDAAIAWAEEHPEQHDQGDPFAKRECGTTACLAGIICVLDGWEPIWRPGETDAYWVEKGGEERNAMALARELIGADGHQADALFLGAMTLAAVKATRNAIAAATSGEAGERSDTPNAPDLGGDR